MKFFYATILWLTRLDLAIAKAAPVRNSDYIEALKEDEMKWELALKLWEVNHDRA